jgi:4-hydroxy-tetrahydrodipicolinate synthase
VDAARDHLRAGADAVVAMLPNYFKLEPADMEAYFRQLASRIEGSVLLYNMPATTGMSVPLDVIERLSHVPNIKGLKDSEGTVGRREQVAERFKGRADFALFMGVAAHSVAALRLGFVGLVPSSGNLYPQLWHELYAAAEAGNWARAEELQRRLDAIGAVFQRNRTLGQSLAALKAGAASLHLCEPYMMPPLRALDSSEQERVRTELSAVA